MIPKIIHYCWFGNGKLPPLALKCIESWKRFCPDYQIICWNEDNYDISKNKYMLDAYNAKKWGFVPDYARLDIIYNNGGIYLDTDVELIKPIDDLLLNRGYAGVEKPGVIALGLGFGAEKKHPMIKLMLDQYENLSFINDDGTLNLTPAPALQTEFLKEYGLISSEDDQIIGDDFVVYRKEVFNPCNSDNGKIEITDNTYSIHHYAGSWVSKKNKFHKKVYIFLCRVFGVKTAKKIRGWVKKNEK